MAFGWVEVIAIVAACISGGSLWLAIVANRHSAEANREVAVANVRASAALDLQKQIDDRAREFRDVRWTGEWVPYADIDAPLFRISNTGLTAAEDVTLVITLPTGERQMMSLGTLRPRERRDVDFEPGVAGGAGAAILARRMPPYTVHWSSPLGQVEEWSDPGTQIY